MRKSISIMVVGLILFLAWVNFASAEIVNYVDENGKIHYVNTDYKRVPDKYLPQIPQKAETPTVRELPPQMGNLTDYSSAALEGIENFNGSEQDPMSSVSVELFVSASCVSCVLLESFLRSKDVVYTKYNIDSDPVGIEKYKQLQIDGVPVTKVGSEIIQGANGTAIILAIKKQTEEENDDGGCKICQ